MSIKSDLRNITKEFREMREHPKDRRYKLSFRKNAVDMLTDIKYFTAITSLVLIPIFNMIVQKTLNVLYFDGWDLGDTKKSFLSMIFATSPQDKLIEFAELVNVVKVSEISKSLWRLYLENGSGYKVVFIYSILSIFLGSIGIAIWYYNIYIKTKQESGKYEIDVKQDDVIETAIKVPNSFVKGKHANGTEIGEMPSVIIGDIHYPFTLHKLKYKPELAWIDWEGLRTHLLTTGTTGTGKTFSSLYPITRQLLEFMPNTPDKKTGMLVLDVKGDFYKQILDFAKAAGRLEDVILINLGGKWKYNPLQKPDMLAGELANRVIEIARARDGNSKNGDNAFWENQGKAFIENAIRLARLHSNYVSFKIIDSIIRGKQHNELLAEINERYEKGYLSETEEYDFKKTLKYFEIEIDAAREDAAKVMKIVEQTIQPMINSFLQEKIIEDTFACKKEDLNFLGFDEMINKGLIVCLAMDAATYPALAPYVASYLALDFQKTTLQRIKPDTTLNFLRPIALVCDECHFMMSPSWGDWLSVARQSNTCAIFATQSYQSLYAKMDANTVESILQNINNKIWLGSDDDKTLTDMVKTCGKYEKEKVTRSINETALKGGMDVTGGTIRAQKSNIALNTSISTEDKDRIRYEQFKAEMPDHVALINVARRKERLFEYKENRKLVSLCYLKNWKEYNDVTSVTEKEEYELINGKTTLSQIDGKTIDDNVIKESNQIIEGEEAESENEDKSTHEDYLDIDFDF